MSQRAASRHDDTASGVGRLWGRRLYLCTPDREDLEDFIAACIQGGVDIVQLREKKLGDRALIDRARLAGAVCRDLGVPFILNDRPDLALEVGADGVHVGQDDVPISLVRKVMGGETIVGLSTHAAEEFDASLGSGADYISAGPVVETPTKPGREGTGLGYVSHVAASETRPWFVTGGITPDTVGPVASAGGRRFVVVRYLTQAADPKAAAGRLREAIDKALATLA